MAQIDLLDRLRPMTHMKLRPDANFLSCPQL
ncbi:uncharacterized protein G2W53_031964 [Senna tora]|uniref:Uncharacterized protein n=1 Tax=Senna tora TaxID=362788 RepID=A0A834SWP8_9FABA|nr:uncharacterized protein G2W53_031964 [Senna tora]